MPFSADRYGDSGCDAFLKTALQPFSRRPKAAAGFSALCPGCGYFYLGRPLRALAYLGASAALIGASLAVLDASPTDASGFRVGGPGRFISHLAAERASDRV